MYYTRLLKFLPIKKEAALTFVEGSIWRFLEAKLAVGLERMTTLTLCFTMIVFILMIYS